MRLLAALLSRSRVHRSRAGALPAPRSCNLPPGMVEIAAEMLVGEGADRVPRRARGHRARMAAGFPGARAVRGRGHGVRLRDFTIDGNREALEQRDRPAASDVPFARFTRGNGSPGEGGHGLAIERRAVPRDRGIRRAGEPLRDVPSTRARRRQRIAQCRGPQ